MALLEKLQERSQSNCELCKGENELEIYTVSPHTEATMDHSVLICQKCVKENDDPGSADTNHWRCLNDSIWSEQDPVKVLSYRMLHHLSSEDWTQDLIDMMYLEEDVEKWAKQGLVESKIIHKDAHGATLLSGDNVVLIQDLNVKGAGFTAKRGTAVRRITLVKDNAEHIEGKINGQHIVLLTKYVKKKV